MLFVFFFDDRTKLVFHTDSKEKNAEICVISYAPIGSEFIFMQDDARSPVARFSVECRNEIRVRVRILSP